LGFSSAWLALREPADRAARDPKLLRIAIAAAGPNPVILDLGCGTGSTFRALEPYLPSHAKWRLVDNDPGLLKLAGTAAGDTASLYQQDLQLLGQLPLEEVTLVTASALLDLVSKRWLIELAALLNVPAYFALSYNGIMSWSPKNEHDVVITNAFNAHQKTDKGFGPALGPEAVETAQEVFLAAGFEVQVADSPWQLGQGDQELQIELVTGIAAAAKESGESASEPWLAARVAAAEDTTCVIGHGDLLAFPKPRVAEVANAFS
jgi:SAM-dependent methyltransferase